MESSGRYTDTELLSRPRKTRDTHTHDAHVSRCALIGQHSASSDRAGREAASAGHT